MSRLDFVLSREWSLVLAAVCLLDAALVYARLKSDPYIRQFIREAIGIIAITVLFGLLFVWSHYQQDDRTVRIVFRLALWFAFTNIFIANLIQLWRHN